ncbi:MAG: SGNH/GDSL hydrolase family protein [Candidatus Aminicenantes bacterium]|nr:MAG: SGNH/GDSL hydrolase family protein [Candidatus Aminicenantes bacterium]
MLKTITFWTKTGSILIIIALFFSCSSPPPNYIILCAGDSITEEGYPPFLVRILKGEGIQAKVLNYGKSGHTSGEYLRFLLEKKTEWEENHPDFIFLQLGTNDVRTDHDHTSADEFSANMRQIIQLFRDFTTRSGKDSHILLATIPPIPDSMPFPFSSQSAKRVTKEINPLIQKIALEEKLILVDNFSVFLKSPHLLPDVHPSDQGYEALAQNWYTALKKEGVRPTGNT